MSVHHFQSTTIAKKLAANAIGGDVRNSASTTERVALLSDALRDAARWLESAASTCGMQSLRDAAARAQSTLAEVAHG